MGLLGDVTGILLQALNAHHHDFCLCEAAHQARKLDRQGQGIRQREAHQPWGEEKQLLGDTWALRSCVRECAGREKASFRLWVFKEQADEWTQARGREGHMEAME